MATQMNDINVLRITRRGADAVLFVEKPIEAGTEVLQKVDWTRRFDHMQQHSGENSLGHYRRCDQ